MVKSPSNNATHHDLEQQLYNVLEFVTTPPNGDMHGSYDSDSMTAFKKGLYYLQEKSFPLATKWLRMAAMQGDNKAQFYLGLMFLKGQGVPQSPFHAMAWLSLAESQGVEAAKAVMEQLKPHLNTKRIRDAQCYAATLYEQIHQLNFQTTNNV